MTRALLLSLALVAAVPAAPAADRVFDHPATTAQLEKDLAAVIPTLRAARTLRGDYVQKKTLAEVPKPLVADGTYLFVRDVGICWRTVKPFASQLTITSSEMVNRDAGGAVMRIGAEQQPGIRTVASLFFAVFALDFKSLEQLFELSSRRTAQGWELGLLPKASARTGPIREIVVSGRSQVERVVMQDAHGDVTDIRFRNPRAASAAPGADDLALFKD